MYDYACLYIIIDVDINEIRVEINEVLKKEHAKLVGLPEASLPSLAAEMYAVGLVSIGVKNPPTFDGIINEFVAGLKFQENVHGLEEDLKKFLKSFKNVGGSFSTASRVIQNKWTDIIRRQLNVKLNLMTD